jgi:hypothetical protein
MASSDTGVCDPRSLRRRRDMKIQKTTPASASILMLLSLAAGGAVD